MLAASLLLVGCASSHNLRESGYNLFGGGYYDYALRPGLHYIKARSNLSIVLSPGAAKTTWQNRAETLCRSESYAELKILESVEPVSPHMDYSQAAASRYLVAVRDGYALCRSSGMSPSEAQSIIETATK